MSDFVNIFKVPELRKRLLFTGLILIVYRIGAHIPTPGIDAAALGDIFAKAGGTLFGFFDLFSGGALRRARSPLRAPSVRSRRLRKNPA